MNAASIKGHDVPFDTASFATPSSAVSPAMLSFATPSSAVPPNSHAAKILIPNSS